MTSIGVSPNAAKALINPVANNVHRSAFNHTDNHTDRFDIPLLLINISPEVLR